MAWQTKKLKAEDLEKKEEVATFTKKKENGTFEKEEIKDFYENPEIPFEKGPTRTSPKIWLLIFLSLVFGFLGGLAVNFFVFRNQLLGFIQKDFILLINLFRPFMKRVCLDVFL